MDIEFIRGDIEQRRRQIARQRKEILDLQRAGISTKSAEELLARMLSKVDELCAERDRLVWGISPQVRRQEQVHPRPADPHWWKAELIRWACLIIFNGTTKRRTIRRG